MTTSKPLLDRNTSTLGRLLEELSWLGTTIRNYRNGGRGYENVLTAEALQGLDFLPRSTLLGSVLSASQARTKLVALPPSVAETHWRALTKPAKTDQWRTPLVLNIGPSGSVSALN